MSLIFVTCFTNAGGLVLFTTHSCTRICVRFSGAAYSDSSVTETPSLHVRAHTPQELEVQPDGKEGDLGVQAVLPRASSPLLPPWS